MGVSVTLDLPVPPSANRYWRQGRNRVYRSDEATTYKALVAVLAKKQWKRPPTTLGISLTIVWYRKQAKGDLSNRIKILEDALIGTVYKDDRQVREIHAFMYDSEKDNPRIVTTVTTMEGL